jgi:hypothetical protein
MIAAPIATLAKVSPKNPNIMISGTGKRSEASARAPMPPTSHARSSATVSQPASIPARPWRIR